MYSGAGKPRPHAPITIGDRDFLYDFNGNQVGWDNRKNGSKRRNVWDEEDRLREVKGPQGITRFAYDDRGQRAIKLGRQGETVYVNQFYVVRNGAIVTKNVYAGDIRLASKLQPGTVPSRGGGGGQGGGPGRGGGAGGGPPSLPPGQGGQLPPGLEKKDDLPPGRGGVNPGRGRERRSERAQERAQDVYKNPTLTGEKPGRGGPAGGAAATEVQGQRAFTGEQPGEFLYFYHPDQVGSTSYVTDDKGAIYEHLEYFPFGETWVQEGQPSNRIPYLFSSKELDQETGLYYFGARYYDPRTSVWVSPDPILNEYLRGSASGGVFQSVNLALYSYVFNNPVRLTDPLGLHVIGDPPDPIAESKAEAGAESGGGSRGPGGRASGFVSDGKLTVVRSGAAQDDLAGLQVSTVKVNENNVVDVKKLLESTGFVKFKAGSRAATTFLNPQVAARLVNALNSFFKAFPNDEPFIITDTGIASGLNFRGHKTHNMGRSADIRYKDANGRNIQGKNAVDQADPTRMAVLNGFLQLNGFDQNYSFGSTATRLGVKSISGHETHFHFGVYIGKFKSQYAPKQPKGGSQIPDP